MNTRNAADRIGQRLPELLEELGAPRIPDYYPDLLRATAATPQKPSWASIERWLPMGAVARPLPRGVPMLGPILVLVALALAIVAGSVLLAGNTPKPALGYGPAENGVLVAKSTDGAFVVVDPDTGTTRAFGGLPDAAIYPYFLRTGQSLMYSVLDPYERLFAANADGTNPRVVFEGQRGATVQWIDESPDASQVAVIVENGAGRDLRILDVATGTVTPITLPFQPALAYWRPQGDLVITGQDPAATTDADWGVWRWTPGSVAPVALSDKGAEESYYAHPTVTPDGRTLVFDRWDGTVSGQLSGLDVESGQVHQIQTASTEYHEDVSPTVSPDGKTILFARNTEPGWRLTLAPIDGNGPVRSLGEIRGGGADGSEFGFSPDGSTVFATYEDGTSVLYDAATGDETPIDGASLDGFSWQRR